MFGQDPAGQPALLAGPGAVAALYAGLGGPVHHVGKPHAPIYAHCLAVLGNPAPSRVLAVGDSLDHDILGGNRAGMPTVLIADGVHAPRLLPAATPAALAAGVLRLAPSESRQPCWVLRSLAW
jgi:ribonucleotide monophosphatase NagD (HAD superfamily)